MSDRKIMNLSEKMEFTLSLRAARGSVCWVYNERGNLFLLPSSTDLDLTDIVGSLKVLL
jgi:hypothetical protein